MPIGLSIQGDKITEVPWGENETEDRISRIEHRLDEIERAVIAMYKYSFERDALMPRLAEIEPLLTRMKEVKMELTQ
jgi:hypothetical protein